MKYSKETKERISKTKRLQYEQSGGMSLEQREKIREGQRRRWTRIREGLTLLDALQKASKQAERLLD